MAGLGRRTFAPGEVLTSSNVMNYLMDQSIMNFAGTAARGSAIGTAVSEGMVSYLANSNAVEVYDGSAWKSVYPSVANTGEIVRVLQTAKHNVFSTTSTSFVDVTGLSVTITPKATTNKILVIANIYMSQEASGDALIRLLRGATVINSTTTGLDTTIFGHVSSLDTGQAFAQMATFIDSPNTTSATTYKVQVRGYSTGTTHINRRANGNFGYSSSITVMEVVA
jgi:hypothetical protein